MSNYCDESYYQQNIYTNTYSLWGNSAYYDINNLSPQNYCSSWHRGNEEDFETRYTSGPTEVKPSEPPDHRNRRTVDRDSLYVDPETFYEDVKEEISIRNATPDWESVQWQACGTEAREGTSSLKMGRPNRIQKKLDKMLAKPVKITKAESMMQKMGWNGGALGRSASGIVEPIAPNAVYATQRKGLGQTINHSIPQPIPKATNPKTYKKEDFTMNILYNIYEFVRNNSEVELLFDRTLSKEERKRVHTLVQCSLNDDGMSLNNYESTAQLDILRLIQEVNCYLLQTQSEGEYPNRQLCLYKEAPEDVYLIIPDDLRDEPVADDAANDPAGDPANDTAGDPANDTTGDPANDTAGDPANDTAGDPANEPAGDPKEEVSDNEMEEETNPFLRSITRNLKKTKDANKDDKMESTDPPKETSISEKILEYFSEFAEKSEYTQFKFLGPFNDEESGNIRDFMEKASQYLNNEPCDVKETFDKVCFEFTEDTAGNTVITKRPK